jgi:hypothetical protein
MAGQVLAFPAVLCPLCGVSLGADPTFRCGRRCGTEFHVECSWRRIASIDEWKVYFHHVVETNDEFKPNVVCTACRQVSAWQE